MNHVWIFCWIVCGKCGSGVSLRYLVSECYSCIFFFLQQFLSLCMERFQWRYNPPTVLVLRKEAFFAWAVCCTITDHVICSREWFSLHPSKNNLFTYTQLFEHLIEWFLKNIITLSEMGKQSAQAKNVYLTIIHQRHSEYC